MKMVKIVREDYYFDEAGFKNTDYVVEAVTKRIKETKCKVVVVASTSGETAVKFAQALERKAQVVCVTEPPYIQEWGESWPGLKPEFVQRLEELGATVIEKPSYFFHSSVLEGARWETAHPDVLVKNTLYAFGQGLKVAIEVVFIAVMCGYIEPYQEVIGVGGTTKGADTAAIIYATHPQNMFAKKTEKRLEVREIIAMPRKKGW